jgi:cytochrome P450
MINPPIYDQVVSEIDNAVDNGTIDSTGPVAYAQAIKLPLLCASIKEALRLHPSVGLTLPRDVPPQGLYVAGTFIPGGYRVGMNAAVVQYNQSVFGDDADSFRPSRWLSENTAEMNRAMLHFGAGTRTCLGKNVSN